LHSLDGSVTEASGLQQISQVSNAETVTAGIEGPGNGSAMPVSCAASIIGPNRPSGRSAAQVDITAVPPGRVTLRISATAAARSGKNCSPCWHSTTSKLSSSAAIADAGHCRYSIAAHPGACGRADATASMAALISLA
jgi:hypothetical protein